MSYRASTRPRCSSSGTAGSAPRARRATSASIPGRVSRGLAFPGNVSLVRLPACFKSLSSHHSHLADSFGPEQLYALICLSHGGTDLETAKLRNWQEATSVLWQVAQALSTAEQQLQFEVGFDGALSDMALAQG